MTHVRGNFVPGEGNEFNFAKNSGIVPVAMCRTATECDQDVSLSDRSCWCCLHGARVAAGKGRGSPWSGSGFYSGGWCHSSSARLMMKRIIAVAGAVIGCIAC